MPRLSIIVPVLNEAAGIEPLLASFAALRERGAEVVVVDGGSQDASVAFAHHGADQVLSAPRGRGAQMNAGAAAARGDVLLFLHADTRLPSDADRLVCEGLERSGRAWGRFDITVEGRSAMLPFVALFMNVRSRLTGIVTGDHAVFVTRAAFVRAGGFPDIPLMEDIEMSRRLKRVSPPLCLNKKVVTSGRRWDERGAWRTILFMWRLRLAHFLGTAPEVLARRYGYVPRQP